MLYYEAYQKLSIHDEQMVYLTTPLVGFNGELVRTIREITLRMTVGEKPWDVTNLTKFFIVDAPFPTYNVIIGRPTLNTLQVVISTVHLKIEFHTPTGVGEVRGDQIKAKECRCHFSKEIDQVEQVSGPNDIQVSKSKKK